MNLLRIIADMDPVSGGPCQGIRNSIPEMEKLGVHNEVVSLDDPHSPFIKKDGFTIHALGKGRGPWRYHPELLPWLIRNIARYDAVIVHGLWLYPNYAVEKARATLGQKCPKIFVMPHGMLDPYFQQAPGRKLKAIRNYLYWRAIESKTVNNAHGILFTCEQEMLLARKPFKPYRPKLEINASYGIAAPPSFRKEMQEAFSGTCKDLSNKPYILFLSRIHEKKGVDLLIQAYQQLRVRYQGSPNLPDLVIAGPGMESSYGQKLRHITSSNKSIHFPGMLSGDAKWGAYYGSEAFVLPSHQENFGIALAEALACQKPALITNKVNIWREVSRYNAGIVEDDTLEGVRSALETWINLPAQRKQQMARNAFNCFNENFSIRDSAKKLAEAIKQTLATTN